MSWAGSNPSLSASIIRKTDGQVGLDRLLQSNRHYYVSFVHPEGHGQFDADYRVIGIQGECSDTTDILVDSRVSTQFDKEGFCVISNLLGDCYGIKTQWKR